MTDTATRPYTYHSTCTHGDSKQDRRRCRNNARRGLAALPVKDLYGIAKEVELKNRSKATKAEFTYLLSFAPAVRLTFNS